MFKEKNLYLEILIRSTILSIILTVLGICIVIIIKNVDHTQPTDHSKSEYINFIQTLHRMVKNGQICHKIFDSVIIQDIPDKQPIPNLKNIFYPTGNNRTIGPDTEIVNGLSISKMYLEVVKNNPYPNAVESTLLKNTLNTAYDQKAYNWFENDYYNRVLLKITIEAKVNSKLTQTNLEPESFYFIGLVRQRDNSLQMCYSPDLPSQFCVSRGYFWDPRRPIGQRCIPDRVCIEGQSYLAETTVPKATISQYGRFSWNYLYQNPPNFESTIKSGDTDCTALIDPQGNDPYRRRWTRIQTDMKAALVEEKQAIYGFGQLTTLATGAIPAAKNNFDLNDYIGFIPVYSCIKIYRPDMQCQ